MDNPIVQLFISVITHPAFGVIIFLAGVWFGNHFALGRDRRKEFNDAAAKFNNVIVNEITVFKSRHRGFRMGKPDMTYLNQIQAAILGFGDFLTQKEIRAIDNLWQKYKEHEESRAEVTWDGIDDQAYDFLVQFMEFSKRKH